jgi:hypothetical protein
MNIVAQLMLQALEVLLDPPDKFRLMNSIILLASSGKKYLLEYTNITLS